MHYVSYKIIFVDFLGNIIGSKFCSLMVPYGPKVTDQCKSVNLASFPLNQPLFEINVTCTVKKIKFFFTGIDCGADISYGPNIGALHLVEIYTSDTQECHVPFISRTTAQNKCKVTVEYLESSTRSPVILQARLRYNENVTITICKKDVHYVCV